MKSNLEKIISMFETIKEELQKNKQSFNETLDYEKVNSFLINYGKDIFALLEVDEFKANMELSQEDSKELEEITKVLSAFNNNSALSFPKTLETEIRGKKSVLGVLGKLNSLLKEYRSYKKSMENYEKDILQIDNIINGLKSKSNVDYIENVDEIYSFLYKKKNIDLKVKFEVYRLIGEYNILVGKNKLELLKSNEEVKEEDFTSVLDSLRTVFAKHNYDLDKVNKKLIETLFVKADVKNVDEVFSFFESIGLRFNESLKSGEKYLMMLVRSDKQALIKIQELSKHYGFDFKDFIDEFPSTAMRKTKQVRKIGKPKKKGPVSPSSYTGAYEDCLANIKTLEALGYDISKAMIDCPSIFSYPNESLVGNIKALELYGINVKDSNGTFKLSGLKNTNVLFTIDQFIELGELPYLTYNTSRFMLSPHDVLFYRLYKIKKYNAEHPLSPIEYKTPRGSGYDFKAKMSDNKEGSAIVDRDKDYHEQTNTIVPQIFDAETTERLEKIIREKRAYFNRNTKNIDIIKYLDLKYKSPKSDSTYLVGGKIFSRIKVMRLLSILEDEDLDRDKLILFCLTYNSIISEEEYNRVYNAICELERTNKHE